MKVERIKIDPPQDAFIVTRARTLRGLTPLPCKLVERVMRSIFDPVEKTFLAYPIAYVATVHGKHRVIRADDAADSQHRVNHAIRTELEFAENDCAIKRLRATLADDDAKDALAADMKRIAAAREALK
jgi:hypothetical protein